MDFNDPQRPVPRDLTPGQRAYRAKRYGTQIEMKRLIQSHFAGNATFTFPVDFPFWAAGLVCQYVGCELSGSFYMVRFSTIQDGKSKTVLLGVRRIAELLANQMKNEITVEG